MWEALDREEERHGKEKSAPVFERQQLVLRPTDEEYEAWCAAAESKPVNRWALEALNEIAKERAGRSVLKVAEDDPGFHTGNGKAG